MKFLYAGGYYLTQAIFDTLYPGEVWGVHHIPPRGGFLLAANHASFFDPPAVGCRVPREIHYLARKTLFKKGLIGNLLRNVNAIPVDRDGDSDVGSLKTVIRTLRGGKGLILFPEGTRTPNGKIQDAKAGLGMIACRAEVPVIPTRIFGSYEAYSRKMRWPRVFTPIDVHFGKPLFPSDFDPGGRGKDRYQEATDRIMNRLRALSRPTP
ncbi:MAG: 1-acyl-sn-glycerol-3-phosphate acyltransferase [Opitutales bacterium]|nr:1-acyl-sn-glycerol-3-phosphate acyltransferase [Opitutales bacterium]MCH8540734.1 1-acyl-sn-glycerol-3-phosphate acyltransferase [Opitutales bacterium]